MFAKETNYTGQVNDQAPCNWNLANQIRREELDNALESMSDFALSQACKGERGWQEHVIFQTNVHPKWLVEGCVTLIPKIAKPTAPKDFCPMTVSSILLRVFHKVLAKRLDTIEICKTQVAYIRGILNKSGVWINDKYSKQRSRVKQGDPISGTLFNLVMDQIYAKLLNWLPALRKTTWR